MGSRFLKFTPYGSTLNKVQKLLLAQIFMKSRFFINDQIDMKIGQLVVGNLNINFLKFQFQFLVLICFFTEKTVVEALKHEQPS